MKIAWTLLTILAVSALSALVALAGPPRRFVAPTPPIPVPAQPAPEPQPAAQGKAGEEDMQALLEKLSRLSETIAQANGSPDTWRNQIAQGELLLQLATRSQGKEREEFLKMAIECHYGAAVLSPENDGTAVARLAQLPDQIARDFPGSPLVTAAVRQRIQADYVRVLDRNGGAADAAKLFLRDSLTQFARDYPLAPETPAAVTEAGQLSEEMGKVEEAKRCYRYLVANFGKHPLARKAEGSLCRLGEPGEALRLNLPLIYQAGGQVEEKLDLDRYHGKLVAVYFWQSTAAQAADDFAALKDLKDRYGDNGLEVVYVNVDSDVETARAFLSGRLTGGEHVFQCGGLESPVVQRCGIQSLPQAILIGPDGGVIRHSLQVSQLENLVPGHLPQK